ncbi:hypothetical protein ACRAWF_30580 [Streptomyces sp. L7]
MDRFRSKSNIGHLECAAGLLGIVKAVLILRHGLVPPIAGLTHARPDLPFTGLPVALADRPVTWPRDTAVRRIGVNSFGVGGSPGARHRRGGARGDGGLRRRGHLRSGGRPPVRHEPGAGLSRPRRVPGPDVGRTAAARSGRALARTAQTGRAALRERRVLVAADLAELADGLKALAVEQAHVHVATDARRDALGRLPAPLAHTAGDWLDGLSVDWDKYWPHPQLPARWPDLPSYPFQRRAALVRRPRITHADHPVDRPLISTTGEPPCPGP